MGAGSHELGSLSPQLAATPAVTAAVLGGLSLPYTKAVLPMVRTVLSAPRPAPAVALANAIRGLGTPSGVLGALTNQAVQAGQSWPFS